MKIQDLPVFRFGQYPEGYTEEDCVFYPLVFIDQNGYSVTWRTMSSMLPKGHFCGIGLMICKCSPASGRHEPIGIQLDVDMLEFWPNIPIWEGHEILLTLGGLCFQRMKCFVCNVEGLALRFVDAINAREARAKLEQELMGLSDPHDNILSITEVITEVAE